LTKRNWYIRSRSEDIRVLPYGEATGALDSGTQVEVLGSKDGYVKVMFSGWIPETAVTDNIAEIDDFRLRASHILLADEKSAKGVLDMLRNGNDFTRIAREFSLDKSTSLRGGDLGVFHPGEMLPDIERIVMSLKIGEVSDVVKTRNGYHLIMRTL
jgi:hypothetical protein